MARVMSRCPAASVPSLFSPFIRSRRITFTLPRPHDNSKCRNSPWRYSAGRCSSLDDQFYFLNITFHDNHRVQTLPVVPLIDCYERVKNHVMASLALFEQTNQPSDLQAALAALEGVTMQYFTKEMHAELTAYRSQVCIKLMK